jgi:hypothetical protein
LNSDFDPTPILSVRTHDKADLLELRYLQQLPRLNVTVGVGDYRGDGDQTITFQGNQSPPAALLIRHSNVYAYSDIELSKQVTLGIGMSYDDYDGGRFKRNPVNPKLGVIWILKPSTTLRAVALRAFQRTLISSRRK